MEQQRSRIVEDLRGLLTGEIASGDVTRQLYATDASLFQVEPAAVVFPQSTADVSACLRYCRENEIHVHARGAGTGLSGESLGDGIVLDFSRNMRRVLGEAEDRVRVQPGIAYERLNAFLAERGRQIGPQPHNLAAGTMGGMLGTNATGSRGLKYGSMRSYVESMQVVLADGSVLEIGSPTDNQSDELPTESGVLKDLSQELSTLLTSNAEVLSSAFEQRQDWDVGYYLKSLRHESGEIDLRKLLVGSEGTLAVVTEATIRTSPIPRYRAAALLFFDSLEKAARGAAEAAAMNPTVSDLIDRRQLTLAREWDSFYELVVPVTAEAMLFIEHDADDLVEVRDHLQQTVDRIRRRKRLAFDSRQAFDEEEFRLFWQLATPVAPLFYRLGGRHRPVPFADDVVVPMDALPQMIVAAQNILKDQQLTAAIFAHAGSGRLQIRPIIDPADAVDVDRLPAFAEALYDAAIGLGGAISGGGVGMGRTPYLERQFSEDVLRVFRHVKRAFDPSHILNPGKITGSSRSLEHARTSWDFSAKESAAPQQDELEESDSELSNSVAESGKDVSAEPVQAPADPSSGQNELVTLHLDWTQSEALNAAWQCNGCGECRTQAPSERMCPLYRTAPAEVASPRAKANAMRGLLSGELNADTINSDEFKELVDLCVNCHMCRLECPAAVDIPRLMTEARGQYVASKGLRFSDWIVSRLDILGRMGSRNQRMANWMLHNRTMRWLMEKTVGLAQGRKLPTYTKRTFLRSAHRRRLTRPTMRSNRKVAYFCDHYVNYHDPELGDAVVAILERQGIAVYVPPKQKLSGMSMISVGNLDRARKVAQHNLQILAECVRQGYHVIANEPAAVLCLTREYPALLNTPDARLVAENTSEVCEYLLRLHDQGELRLDFHPLAGMLAYHTPCHLKALEMGTPGLELMRLIPGLSIRRIEDGCSGMAGTFGLKKHNYRASLRAGWGLISRVRQSDFQFGATECSACKMQMEQGTSKPTIHPLKLLAKSYGLMSKELQDLLHRKSDEFTVT